MKKRSALSVGLGILVLLSSATIAAGARQSAADTIPRMPDGKPDLSGIWWGGNDVGGGRLGVGVGEAGPSFTDLYTPSAAAHAATLSDKDDPTLRCVPTAFGTLNVRLWDVGALGQIVSTPEVVVFLTETYHSYQAVPTDGRPHRTTVPPSWRGDAVGHWEGDTFVVEITNFTDDTWMFAEGRASHHSDQLRIVERYRRVDQNTLEIDAFVEDPEVLTQPWVVQTQRLTLAPFDQLLPLDCRGDETFSLIQGIDEE